MQLTMAHAVTLSCICRKQFAEKLEVIAEPERKRRLTVGLVMAVSTSGKICIMGNVRVALERSEPLHSKASDAWLP